MRRLSPFFGALALHMCCDVLLLALIGDRSHFAVGVGCLDHLHLTKGELKAALRLEGVDDVPLALPKISGCSTTAMERSTAHTSRALPLGTSA